MHQGFWNIEGRRAALTCGALSAVVDPRRPGEGLASVVIDARPLDGASLLGVELPGGGAESSALVDVYARGTDLVATYPASDAWPFGAQLYWRVWIPRQASVLAAVELIVSVQTQLLDSQPRLTAGSRFPACDVFRLTSAERGTFALVESVSQSASDGAMLRPADAAWTYGQFVHPRCAAEMEIDPAPSVRVRHQLFAERLEKGVILRARVLAAFVDRARERAELAIVNREFAASDPPLTT